MRLKIDIFSDIDFNYYQHINHFLYYGLKDKYEVRFLYRFYMHHPFEKKYINKLLKLFHVKKKKGEEDFDQSIADSIFRIINIPHINSFFDRINSYIVRKQIGSVGDICITFVPSPSLHYVLEKYKKKIYYCVHDSKQQGYGNTIINFEKKIASSYDYIFCDNEIVLSRLLDGDRKHHNLLDDNQRKGSYFFVDAPIPDPFFNIEPGIEYDFVYFGSIHENIDFNVFYQLAQNYKILIVSNECCKLQTHDNLYFESATSDINKLARHISTARCILLPYANTEFNNTVTPAKINQSFATGLPIVCSNDFFVVKYNLISLHDIMDSGFLNIEWHRKDVSSLKCSDIINKIESIIVSD